MLDALCAKHGITLDQIAEDKKAYYYFKAFTKQEKRLLAQVVAHITQVSKISSYRLDGKPKEWYHLTELQAADVRECFKHYKRLWQKQLDDFMGAFIQANQIFGKSTGEAKEIGLEEMEKLIAMMRTVKREVWLNKKKLTGRPA